MSWFHQTIGGLPASVALAGLSRTVGHRYMICKNSLLLRSKNRTATTGGTHATFDIGPSRRPADHDLTLQASNLHEVPARVDDDRAVFVEPTAAACQILAQLEVTPRAWVGVVGDSRMGPLVGQVLRSTGASVTILGRHRLKMEVAHRLGLEARPAADVSSGDMYDITVDVTGRPDGLTDALKLVRPRGTVVMKSTVHEEAPTTCWPAVVNEVTLVGPRFGPFYQALTLLTNGVVRTSPLLASIYPLAEFRTAFEEANTTLKILLRPQGD